MISSLQLLLSFLSCDIYFIIHMHPYHFVPYIPTYIFMIRNDSLVAQLFLPLPFICMLCSNRTKKAKHSSSSRLLSSSLAVVSNPCVITPFFFRYCVINCRQEDDDDYLMKLLSLRASCHKRDMHDESASLKVFLLQKNSRTGFF